jgi:hypothetical protein
MDRLNEKLKMDLNIVENNSRIYDEDLKKLKELSEKEEIEFKDF